MTTDTRDRIRAAVASSGAQDAQSLLTELMDIVGAAVAQERARCVALCRARGDTWRNTLAARSSIASAREEARSRANEAAWLADLLETGEDLPLTDDDVN